MSADTTQQIAPPPNDTISSNTTLSDPHTSHTNTPPSLDTNLDLDSLLNDVKHNLNNNLQLNNVLNEPVIHYANATTAYSPNAQVTLFTDTNNTFSTYEKMHKTNGTKKSRRTTSESRDEYTYVPQLPLPIPSPTPAPIPILQSRDNTVHSIINNNSIPIHQRTTYETRRHKDTAMLYYDRAVELVSKAEYYDAILQYSHVLDEWSDDPRVWAGRAMCYYYLKPQPMLRLALLDMNEAIQRSSGVGDFYYRRACIYASMEYNTTFDTLALADFGTCLALQPDRVDALTNRAAIYVRLNMKKQAQTDLERAITINAQHKLLQENLKKFKELHTDSTDTVMEQKVADTPNTPTSMPML